MNSLKKIFKKAADTEQTAADFIAAVEAAAADTVVADTVVAE